VAFCNAKAGKKDLKVPSMLSINGRKGEDKPGAAI
jgi:hypothetical protein